MGLDLRLPIGLLFSILGVLLALFGLLADKNTDPRLMGVNINLSWGVVLLIFGGFMLTLAMRAKRASPTKPLDPKAP